MASKSNENETDDVFQDILVPPLQVQDSDDAAVELIPNNSGGNMCLAPTQISATDDSVNTSTVSVQQSSSHNSYEDDCLMSPQQSTFDLSVALVGRLFLTPKASPHLHTNRDKKDTKSGTPSMMLLPQSAITRPERSIDTMVPGTELMNSTDKETPQKICDAVGQYYMKQFVDCWKKKTKQEQSTIRVVAALLVEKNNKFTVVVLTVGTNIKCECSYFPKKGSFNEESYWGLCDGHAEALCYRMAGVYLVTEIYKLFDKQDSIFVKNEEGYILRKGIKFHLFTSHPPCGFMEKKKWHYLSWKQPFVGKPHCLHCSSTILIGAYLGIQGPLSQLLVKPIYISSITMPRYNTVETLQNSYIEKMFEEFQKQSPSLNEPEGQYSFHVPHIEIVDIDPCTLFRECYTPYIDDKQSLKGYLIPEKVKSNKKEYKNRALNEVAGAIPDVIQNSGIHALIFTVDSGIGSQKFRESVLGLKHILVKLEYGLKKKRLKSLQEAQVRLSQALDIKLALTKFQDILLEQIEESCKIRQRKADEIVELLAKSKKQPNVTAELEALYDELKIILHKANEENELSNVADALGENVTYQKMLDDLKNLLEQEKCCSSDSKSYLDLMGCDWARYIETINSGIFD